MKKLPLVKSKEAVFEVMLKEFTNPVAEPENTELPVTVNDPVILVPAAVLSCNNPVEKSPLINGVAVLLFAIYNLLEPTSLYPALNPTNTLALPVLLVLPASTPIPVF